MRKTYSFLLASIATLFLLAGCKKDAPNADPAPPPSHSSMPALPPAPAQPVMEVETRDNVMVYTPPKGEEEAYIVSYEDNTLLIKYPQEARSLRGATASIYGHTSGGVFKPSVPKAHDIICIEGNKKIPDGLIAEIESITPYGAGDVQKLKLKPTALNQVAKDINYDNTINVVKLIGATEGTSVKVDFSKLLVAGDVISGRTNSKVETPPFKASLTLDQGELVIKVNADPLALLKDRPKSLKSDLSFALRWKPSIRLRIKKRATADLPDLFEVSAVGSVDIDIDAELQAELSKKYAGKRVRLSTIKLPPIPLGSPAFNLVMYLTTDLEFSLEGKVHAKMKIFQYHNPYEYAIGYDVHRPGRWYAGGNDRLGSAAEWFKNWSLEGNLHLEASIQSGISCTINGWEGLSASLGAGITSDNQIKVQAQGYGMISFKSTIEPYLFAGIVFRPGVVEWLEYSAERNFSLSNAKTIFDKEFKSDWDVKVDPKEPWDVKPSEALLGAKFTRNLKNPIEILEYGMCLAEHNQPKISDRKLKYEGAQSTLDYTVKATGLAPATEYFCRGYVMYKKGGATLVAYSRVLSFTTGEGDSGALPEGVVIENGVLNTWPNLSIPESGHVTIPNEVTTIGYKAFIGCSRLKSITFPNKLKKIGVDAFKHCTQLQEVTLPNSVTDIETAAFYGCVNLHTVTLPNKLQVLRGSVFWGCQALKAIHTKSVHRIEDYAFSGCTRLAKVEFTDALISIWDGVIGDCRSLTQVNLPNSVTSVGDYCFSGCLKLKDVQLSESMTYIPWRLFEDCRSLTQLTLPERINEVRPNAFINCIALKSIKSKALYRPKVVDEYGNASKLIYSDKLIVPVGSKDSYAMDSGWGHCNPIVEED